MARRRGEGRGSSGRIPSPKGARGRSSRRAAAVAVGTVVLALSGPAMVAGAGTPPTPPAAAASALSVPLAEDFTEGLRVEATTTYTVDLAVGVVRVEQVATLTNEIPDRVTSRYIEQHYADVWAVPILAGATNLSAGRVEGAGLGVQVEPGGSEFFSAAVVDLSPNLYYGDTQTIRLTYDLPAQPPRSRTLAQVNGAFATFPMFSPADPGLATITVVVPSGLANELVGDEMACSTATGQTVCTAAGIADPASWNATIIVRDDDALVEQTVAFGESDVHIEGWPGDTEWLDFTSDLAERGLPALAGAIGRDWAVPRDLRIVETSAPYVYGYAGWYEQSRSLIEVGDALDPLVTLHEMSHVWFNDQLFQGRWLNEALANEFAALAMTELGLERPLPEAVVPDGPGALPLNDWSDPDLDAPMAVEQEDYGYNTSWSIAHGLVEEIGADGMADVIQAAAEHRSPYPAQTADTPLTWTADWHTLLDLLEGVGGSTTAEQVFRDLVVGDADVEVLDRRAAARDEYATLLAAGDGWAPPAAVRDAMARWEFEDATGMVPDVTALFERRDAAAAALVTIDEVVPIALQERFEASNDLDELAAAMDEVETAVATLIEAVTAAQDAGPLARVGLLFGHVDDDIDAAHEALARGNLATTTYVAQRAIDDVAAATRAGALRLAALLAALLLIGVGVRRIRRRPRRRTTRDAGTGTGTEAVADTEAVTGAGAVAASQADAGARPGSATAPPAPPPPG